MKQTINDRVSDSGKKSSSFLLQSVHTVFARVLILVFSLGTGMFTARFLGPAGKGTLALYGSLAAMLIPLGDLGIRQAIALQTGKKDYSVHQIYGAMLCIYVIASLLCVGALSIIYRSLGLFEQYGYFVSGLFLAFFCISLFTNYSNGLFLGLREIEKINYNQFFEKALNFGFIFLFLGILNLGLIGAAAGSVLSVFFVAGLSFYWHFKSLQVRPQLPSRDLLTKLFTKGIVFAIALFVIQLNYRVDTIMLSKMKSEAVVGIYSVGVNLSELLKQVPLALGLVLYSRSTNWQKNEEDDSSMKAAFLTRITFWVMLGASTCLALISNWLVPFLYGDAFAKSAQIIFYLLPGIVALTVFLILSQYVAGQGKPQITIYAFLPALFLNVLMNLLLIPPYGGIGAAVSSTLSYAFAAIVYIYIFCLRYKCAWKNLFFIKKDDFDFIFQKFSNRLGR